MCRAESGTLSLLGGYAAPKVAPSKQAYIGCMKYGMNVVEWFSEVLLTVKDIELDRSLVLLLY